MANGDDLGFVPAKKTDDFGFVPSKKAPAPPRTTIGPDTRSLLQRAEDWWTSKPSYEGTLSSPGRSPQEKARAIGQGAAIASAPLLAGGLAAAPAATLLGLGGGIAGGYAGGRLGRYAGEQVGAPEIGEDVGTALGGLAGGYTGSKIPSIPNAIAPLVRYPATARQSVLGRPGTIKPILPSMMQKYMIPDWMVPEGELGSPTRPGPFMEIPSRMPRQAPTPLPVDPVAQAVREGRAARLPTRMPLQPKTPPPAAPFLPGATPSNVPFGSAEVPSLPPNLRQPEVQMVERFKPPEQSRIVEPGSKPPDYKVTYQSVPQAELRGKVMSGDADAIREWQRRGLDLPANVGYMVEGGASPKPWRARQQ